LVLERQSALIDQGSVATENPSAGVPYPAYQANPSSIGGFYRKRSWHAYAGHQGNARQPGLLHQFKADSPAQQQPKGIVQGVFVGQQTGTQQLIDGVVPSDVFCDIKQIAASGVIPNSRPMTSSSLGEEWLPLSKLIDRREQ